MTSASSICISGKQVCMQASLSDTASLKITVDERGKVWYIDGNKLPVDSELLIDDFIELPVIKQASRIRTVGLASNAHLLNHLYARKSRGELTSLEICSPLCCERSLDRKNPELLLFKMRSLGVAASLGGWHEFDQRDYPAYALSSLLQLCDGAVDEVALRLATLSPGWRSLSFVAGLHVENCARLIALILDPRWYVDASDDPNSGSKLEQFLGLTPGIQGGTSGRKEDWRYERCQLVLNCWKTKAPSGKALMAPRNFLWRAWKKREGCRGDLIASKLFIAFLRLTWINAVANTHTGRLFVPKYFFADESEVAAFDAHLLQKT